MKIQKPPMEFEVSIVMPCLNEETTIELCIKKAKKTLKSLDIQGGIIVADNGSNDNSVKIAEDLGTSVVHQPISGYGTAYFAGLASAQGQYMIIGDSDDTYDFTDIARFITPLKDGYDMVIGNRFSGQMHKNATPWTNRYIGNPILSGILRLLFHTLISDSHCGMRSFTAEAYRCLALQTTGMEFASEMIVRAVQEQLKIKEIPISYAPRMGKSKLNPFQDALRHIHLLIRPKYKRHT